MTLLRDEQLERSSVVANCCMNRERTLTGPNSYARELGFNPLDLLKAIAKRGANGRWLDICCGSGNSLVEAARLVHSAGLDSQAEIVGVDLTARFLGPYPELTCLRFVEASLSGWRPVGQFDLITCVHGLHYIGDKLGLVQRAVSWLTDEGRFAANLDLNNLKLQDGRPAGKFVVAEWRQNGLTYDSRRKRLGCVGRRLFELPFHYLGADDQSGPNYTGQPAVDSYYELSKSCES